ncbi:MAG: TPR end-of-group domain-containing protein, partial [Thermoanaerobaculia bacterium]
RHDWPPEDLCAEAIEWMELTAMEKGIGKEEKTIDSLFEKRLRRAQKLESAGKTLEAYRAYAAVAHDFRAFRDVSSVETHAADLEKSRRIRDLAQREEKRNAADRGALGQLEATLASVCASEVLPPSTKLLNDLQVPGLKRKAASTSVEDREGALSARRMLENLFARTALFLPPPLLERGDFSCAILLLSVAAEIKPEDPRVFYNRACAYARAGNRKKALTDLRGAIAKGSFNREQLEKDPDLAALREEKGFQEILRGLPEPAPNSGAQ